MGTSSHAGVKQQGCMHELGHIARLTHCLKLMSLMLHHGCQLRVTNLGSGEAAQHGSGG